jgi:hypothetical protein
VGISVDVGTGVTTGELPGLSAYALDGGMAKIANAKTASMASAANREEYEFNDRIMAKILNNVSLFIARQLTSTRDDVVTLQSFSKILCNLTVGSYRG